MIFVSSEPSGEIPCFSDICESVSRDMPSYKVKSAAVGAAVGSFHGDNYFSFLGIGAAIGAAIGAVHGAAVGYSFETNCKYQKLHCRDFSHRSHVDDQRVIKAIAIFKHYEPQLSQSLSYPVRVAELLSKEGVISKDEIDSVEAVVNSSEAVLKAIRKALESDYKRIGIFGDVLCTAPGNEEIGKAICRSYGELIHL